MILLCHAVAPIALTVEIGRSMSGLRPCCCHRGGRRFVFLCCVVIKFHSKVVYVGFTQARPNNTTSSMSVWLSHTPTHDIHTHTTPPHTCTHTHHTPSHMHKHTPHPSHMHTQAALADLTHTQTHTHTPILPHIHIQPPIHTCTLTHMHTHTHSYTHTYSITSLTFPLLMRQRGQNHTQECLLMNVNRQNVLVPSLA